MTLDILRKYIKSKDCIIDISLVKLCLGNQLGQGGNGAYECSLDFDFDKKEI